MTTGTGPVVVVASRPARDEGDDMARSDSTKREIDNFRTETGRKLGGAAKTEAVDAYARDCDKRDASK